MIKVIYAAAFTAALTIAGTLSARADYTIYSPGVNGGGGTIINVGPNGSGFTTVTPTPGGGAIINSTGSNPVAPALVTPVLDNGFTIQPLF